MLTDQVKRIKQEIDLVSYIEDVTGLSAQKVGQRSWRFNPCPGCGGKDHFTVTLNAEGEWFYNTFEACSLKGGDLLHFIERYEGVSDFSERVQKLTAYLRLPPSSLPKSTPGTVPQHALPALPLLNEDFQALRANMPEDNYFSSRGISKELQEKYHLGSHPNGLNHFLWKYPESFQEKPGADRANYQHFIPILEVDGSIHRFLPRLGEVAFENQHKIHNFSGRPSPLFNDRYLEAPELVGEYLFVVEGAFDALSLEEIGYAAIGLNSTSNKNKFIAKIAENPDKYRNKTFVIAADQDDAGRKMAEALRLAFTQYNVSYVEWNFNRFYKDPNEYLISDRAGFKQEIATFLRRMETPDLVLDYMDEYVQEIQQNSQMQGIPTGFPKLDEKLGGGIFSGLYTIGAISSLGKTTFVLQMADSIAASGQDVILFSLEMGKAEVISKSFSRITADMAREQRDNKVAHTTRDILTQKAPKEVFQAVYGRYLPTAQHLSIIEGNFKTDVAEIRQKVERYIRLRKQRPVVVVDYLQILRSPDDRLSDKQAVDRSIVSLKQMSRDLDIPVLLVSSVNRESYASSISFSALKESGAIEYSSDVIMGLQLEAVHEISEKMSKAEKSRVLDEAKNKNPRKVELVILKNRNGVPYAKGKFDFHSKFNAFTEKE